jgi:hypothetical protein
VIHKVVFKREQPDIPDSAPPELRQLYPTLKKCWASEPCERPLVNDIVILGSSVLPKESGTTEGNIRLEEEYRKLEELEREKIGETECTRKEAKETEYQWRLEEGNHHKMEEEPVRRQAEVDATRTPMMVEDDVRKESEDEGLRKDVVVVKHEKIDEESNSGVGHNDSRLKKGGMLPYLLDTLTDFKAGLPHSRLPGSQDFATSSERPGLTPRPRQSGARYTKDLKDFTTKTYASFDSQFTSIKSICSPQITTHTPPRQYLRVYSYHMKQWDRLYTERCLKWDTFPWPTLKQPTSVEEITADRVQEYLQQLPDNNTLGSMEGYVKEHIDRWDYNRMDARVFRRVDIALRKKVEAGVTRVGGILQTILRSIQEST